MDLSTPAYDERGATDLLRAAVREHVFPGAAWGLLHGGTILACEAAGRLTYGDASPAVTCGTVYDMASVTKVMATTAIAMLLWQRGELDLTQPLAAILPEFGEAQDAARNRITVEMLLAHSSGLPAHRHLYAEAAVLAAAPGGQREAALHTVLAMPLEAEPGARAEYSDIGFILLGLALERTTGMGLAEMFSEWIARSLGLQSSGFRTAGALPPGTANGEISNTSIAPTLDLNWRKRELQGEVHDENSALLGGVTGHAGLFSNVPDVLKFADAILRPKVHRLFTAEAVTRFAARQQGPAGTSRALGWDTPSEPSQSGKTFSANSIGHLGYSGTSLWIDLDRGRAVTLLTNRVYTEGSEPSREISSVRPAFHDALLGGE